MGRDLVKQDEWPPAYGALKPSGIVGEAEFAAHDGAQSWNAGDAPAAAADEVIDLVAQLGPQMADIVNAYIAEHVKMGVLEAFRNATADLARNGSELAFLVDGTAHPELAPLAIMWSMKKITEDALNAALKADDHAMIDAIGGYEEWLSGRFRSFQAKPQPAQGGPRRPVRSGAASRGVHVAPADTSHAPAHAPASARANGRSAGDVRPGGRLGARRAAPSHQRARQEEDAQS